MFIHARTFGHLGSKSGGSNNGYSKVFICLLIYLFPLFKVDIKFLVFNKKTNSHRPKK